MSESFMDHHLLPHYHAATGDVLFMLSADGQRFVSLNQAVERLLGHSPHDFLARSELWGSLVVQEDRQRVSDFRHSAGRAGCITYRMQDRSGRSLLLEECLWSTDVHQSICGRVSDITAREQAREEESQQLHVYRMMMARSRDPMAIIGLEETTLGLRDANPAWRLYHDAAGAYPDQSLECLYFRLVMRCLDGVEPRQCVISLSLPQGECHLSVQLISLGRGPEDGVPRVAILARDITAIHQRLEQAVSHHDRLLQHVHETPGARYSFSGEWPPTEWQFLSAGCEALTGLSRDLLMASPRIWQTRMLPEDLARSRQCFADAVAGRLKSLSLCYGFRHVDGRQCYLQDDMSLSYTAQGVLIEVLGQLTEVSQREAGRRQLTHLSDRMPGVLFQCLLMRNDRLTFTYLSPVASQLLGFEVGALLADESLFLERLGEGDEASLLAAGRRSGENQSAWEAEFHYQHPQEGECWLALVALPQPPDGLDGSVLWNGYCHDVTDRHHAEIALRKSEERYRFIMNSVSDLVSIQDASGICQYISPSVEKLCGFRADEIQGREITRLIHPDDRLRVAQEVHRSACMGKDFRIDFRLLHKLGYTLWFESISTPSMIAGSNHYERILSVSRNIHARKLIEQRRELEAMTDSMTGAMTRVCFMDALDTLLSSESRDQVALVLFDIDHFKHVNDCHGHAAGDAVLEQLGRLVRRQLRHADCLARLGGEEFAVLLSDASDDVGVSMAERLRQKVESQAFMFQKRQLKCSISLGVASPHRGESRDDFLHRVDMALYSAKRSGRNRVVLASRDSSADN